MLHTRNEGFKRLEQEGQGSTDSGLSLQPNGKLLLASGFRL